jgi:hypothetical protein
MACNFERFRLHRARYTQNGRLVVAAVPARRLDDEVSRDRRFGWSPDRGSELAGVRIDGIEDPLEIVATLSA